MNSYIKIALAAVLSFCLMVGLQHYAATYKPLEFQNTKAVRVLVINESDYEVNAVSLFHEDGKVAYYGIKQRGQVALKFSEGGENAYFLMATLSNGQTVRSKDEYVEGGYRMRGLITNDTITNSLNDSY